MNIFRIALIVLLFGSMSAMATPASESSIIQLMAITKMHDQLNQSMEVVAPQVTSELDTEIQQELKGRIPNSKEQRAIGNLKSRVIAAMQEQLSWEKMEPMVLQMYKNTFTEEEIDGMLVFYKTPAGQAVINKMPKLMQEIPPMIMQMVKGLLTRMKEIDEEFAAEMKAASD